MRLFLIAAFLVTAAVLIVAATVFRSKRALQILHLLRRVGWVYVIAVTVMGLYYLWQDGL